LWFSHLTTGRIWKSKLASAIALFFFFCFGTRWNSFQRPVVYISYIGRVRNMKTASACITGQHISWGWGWGRRNAANEYLGLIERAESGAPRA
jgi:hypothetical protein